MIICLSELFNLTNKLNAYPKKIYLYFVSLILFIGAFLMQNNYIGITEYVISLLLFGFFSLAAELFRRGNSFKNLSAEFFGLFYISIPFALTNYIVYYTGKFDYKILLGIFIIIWAYDIFAFFIGSSIGKKKIASTISPNKTVEGTIGGIILSMATSVAIYFLLNKYLSFNKLSINDWIIIATIVSIGAFTGDLTESKLKRSAGVKDSGKIMPGHGGLLDRFDSFLFAVVGASLYLMIIKLIN